MINICRKATIPRPRQRQLLVVIFPFTVPKGLNSRNDAWCQTNEPTTQRYEIGLMYAKQTTNQHSSLCVCNGHLPKHNIYDGEGKRSTVCIIRCLLCLRRRYSSLSAERVPCASTADSWLLNSWAPQPVNRRWVNRPLGSFSSQNLGLFFFESFFNKIRAHRSLGTLRV